MGLEVYKNTIVYVAAPSKVASGGPELLHQLAFNLRNYLIIDAYMFYFSIKDKDPVHEEYKKYNNPYTYTIEDNEYNILVVPEIYNGLKLFERYLKIRKVIWWLSIDNYYESIILSNKRNFLLYRIINKLSMTIFKKRVFDLNEISREKKLTDPVAIARIFTNDKFVKEAHVHLVQSFYAKNHLLKRGVEESKIFYLSDYLNEAFVKTETKLSKKEDMVAYNPKKGYSFTKKLINYLPDIKFIPLIHMTRNEVVTTLKKSKVYIDFGNHPGKDRIPREAAILGCCIITNKKGAAAFYEDLPIPEKYKIEDKVENLEVISERIKDCLNNFYVRYNDFNVYREMIRNEKQRFLNDLEKVFIKTD